MTAAERLPPPPFPAASASTAEKQPSRGSGPAFTPLQSPASPRRRHRRPAFTRSAYPASPRRRRTAGRLPRRGVRVGAGRVPLGRGRGSPKPEWEVLADVPPTAAEEGFVYTSHHKDREEEEEWQIHRESEPLQAAAEAPQQEGDAATAAREISRKIEVPNSKVGVLIRKAGETIRNLQTQRAPNI